MARTAGKLMLEAKRAGGEHDSSKGKKLKGLKETDPCYRSVSKSRLFAFRSSPLALSRECVCIDLIGRSLRFASGSIFEWGFRSHLSGQTAAASYSTKIRVAHTHTDQAACVTHERH